MLLKKTSVLATAVVTAGSLLVVTSAPASADPAVAGTYNALTPARIVNTVTGTGAAKAPLKPGQTLNINATSGLGSQAVSAVNLTLTAISPTRGGYLTAYSGAARPGVATLNYSAGESVPNAAAVRVDATGVVHVYNGSQGTVQLTVDRAGYWTGGTVGADNGGSFVPVGPARIVDSRAGSGTPIPARGDRSVTVTGVGGVPASGVTTVAVNVAAVSPASNGFLTATGAATDQTDVDRTTTVAFSALRSRAALAFVPVNSDGTISLHNGATTPLGYIVDVFGYLTDGTPTADGSAIVTSAYRAADSRASSMPLAARSIRKVSLVSDGSGNGILSAAIVSVVASNAGAAGYLTAWNGTSARPNTSVTNFVPATTRTGTAIVPIAADGSISIYNAAGTPVTFMVDVQGFVLGSDPSQMSERAARTSVTKTLQHSRTAAAKRLNR